jgi:hypothetical protein
MSLLDTIGDFIIFRYIIPILAGFLDILQPKSYLIQVLCHVLLVYSYHNVHFPLVDVTLTSLPVLGYMSVYIGHLSGGLLPLLITPLAVLICRDSNVGMQNSLLLK